MLKRMVYGAVGLNANSSSICKLWALGQLLISLGLSFFVCKLGAVLATTYMFVESNEIIQVKCFTSCLAYNKHTSNVDSGWYL